MNVKMKIYCVSKLRNLALILFISIFMPRCLYAGTDSNEESLRVCKEFLETNPASEKIEIFYDENLGDMGMFKTADGMYRLDNYIKFHQISSVVENDRVTSVCVSVVDTTSYSYFPNGSARDPTGWVTFNTRIEVPTSIVNVSTPCWRRYKRLGGCSPVFMPMNGFMDTALFNYCPLNETFWNYVQDETVFKKNWIWRMNFQSTIGNIKSFWVPRLSISSMTELQFIGNDWRRSDTLLGSLPKLEALDLSYNNIEILPNDTLENKTELKKIILGHNNLFRLPYGIGNLHKINLVDLTNPTGDDTLSLPDEDIKSLNRVEILGLERTKLEANVSNIIRLPRLLFLNLSGCFLGNIDDDYAYESDEGTRLTDLDLSFNNLTLFPEGTFSYLIQLRRLFLHDNFLESCTNNSLYALVQLEKLDLSRNSFNILDSDCFSELPGLKELDLSGNKLTVIDSLVFSNLTKLETLKLSHNRISIINAQSFLPLINLQILDLSYNELVEAPTLNSGKMDKLLVTHNNLTRFIMTYNTHNNIDLLDLSENTIQELQFYNVVKLNLSYNSLTHIPAEMWEYLNAPSLVTLDLGGNDFMCCHNDTSVLQRTINTSSRIRNLYEGKSFTCSIDKYQKVLLGTFQYNSTICLEDEPTSTNIYIEIGVAVFFLIALVSFTSALLYFYRTELTYISHLFKMKKRGWERDEERYNVCHYDAFVCYSGKDLKWVMEHLLPNLEGDSGGYRLCVHDRDFTLGAAIDTNVVASLEKSRKVIFVLTKDFIASRWCQWELEMANHKMFEENRGYIILIELERMDKKNMPRHLRYLMDTRTYLEWPQDTTDEQKILRCWKRLRSALGDSITKRTGRGAPKCSVLDLTQNV